VDDNQQIPSNNLQESQRTKRDRKRTNHRSEKNLIIKRDLAPSFTKQSKTKTKGTMTMLRSICNYIQNEDKNSDIMDAYEEYLNQELDKNTLVEICQNILGDWKEDLELNGMTKREKDYYKYLGI
jgi:histone deacetylase complex regulatory component SIN3